MASGNIKETARRLVKQLPEDSIWDDSMHEIYLRQSLEKGFVDSQNARTIRVEEVRQRFGLDEWSWLITHRPWQTEKATATLRQAIFGPIR